MQVKTIISESKLWNKLIDYANSYNREALLILAQKMKKNNFLEREKVFVATENEQIIGFCTFTKED